MRSCSGSPRCFGTDGTLPRLWRGASTVFGGARVPPAAQPQGPMLAPRRDRSGPNDCAHAFCSECSQQGCREESANLSASSRIAADTRSLLRVAAETVWIADGLL